MTLCYYIDYFNLCSIDIFPSWPFMSISKFLLIWMIYKTMCACVYICVYVHIHIFIFLIYLFLPVRYQKVILLGLEFSICIDIALQRTVSIYPQRVKEEFQMVWQGTKIVWLSNTVHHPLNYLLKVVSGSIYRWFSYCPIYILGLTSYSWVLPKLSFRKGFPRMGMWLD